MLKKYESYKKEEYDDDFILSLLHLDDCEIRFNLIEMSYDTYYFYKNEWLYYIARYNYEKYMITFNNQIIINKLNMDYIDKMETLKK
ncbi:hypothetical protein M0Q50_05380 [bacterium]|jgi:hypothetical protein|nr:hypothetical protein [bacterium]